MELVAAWAHDQALRRERTFLDPLDPLHVSDEHLLRYYRFPRHEIVWLCEQLEPEIGRMTRKSHAIPCHTSVLVTLRFYASGSFQSVVGDSTGLSQSSVSRIIGEVTLALYRRAILEVKMPRGVEEITNIKQKFFEMSRFPNVIGAIDCTHVAIKAPYNNEPIYVNRKQYHSLNIQVVCDSETMIRNFSAKYPGSTHDSFIWRNCTLRNRFEAGEFGQSYLLGDSGYPLEPYLMTPISQPENPPDHNYNRSHTQTRVVIEQTFGVLKSRFRCLHKSGGSLQYEPVKCARIAVACMLLHNYCVKRRIPLNDNIEYEDPAQIDNIAQGGHVGVQGRAVRRELVENRFT